MIEQIEQDVLDIFAQFKKELNKKPFIIIIGKYDHILGPRALYSSLDIKAGDFIRDLLRDALNTKNKFVILDFNNFYSQVCKIEVEDKSARGGKQLYAIILLRHVEYPLIPILHFKRIEMLFHKMSHEKILNDDQDAFKSFFREINNIYINKNELLPLESTNLQIRSGINTIQGFCELILEEVKISNFPETNIEYYLEIMLESCKEITDVLDKPLTSTTK